MIENDKTKLITNEEAYKGYLNEVRKYISEGIKRENKMFKTELTVGKRIIPIEIVEELNNNGYLIVETPENFIISWDKN